MTQAFLLLHWPSTSDHDRTIAQMHVYPLMTHAIIVYKLFLSKSTSDEGDLGGGGGGGPHYTSLTSCKQASNAWGSFSVDRLAGPVQ